MEECLHRLLGCGLRSFMPHDDDVFCGFIPGIFKGHRTHHIKIEAIALTQIEPFQIDMDGHSSFQHQQLLGVRSKEVAFSLDHLVGEREKRQRDREESAVLWGVLTGSLRSWCADSGALRAKNTCFAPWGGVNWLSHSGATAWSASGSTDGARLT
jgi:hypothetical protein